MQKTEMRCLRDPNQSLPPRRRSQLLRSRRASVRPLRRAMSLLRCSYVGHRLHREHESTIICAKAPWRTYYSYLQQIVEDQWIWRARSDRRIVDYSPAVRKCGCVKDREAMMLPASERVETRAPPDWSREAVEVPLCCYLAAILPIPPVSRPR